jgi:hypothetical protein
MHSQSHLRCIHNHTYDAFTITYDAFTIIYYAFTITLTMHSQPFTMHSHLTYDAFTITYDHLQALTNNISPRQPTAADQSRAIDRAKGTDVTDSEMDRHMRKGQSHHFISFITRVYT